MSVYEKARELVTALRQEPLYNQFTEWQEKVHSDPQLVAMLTDLRGKEYELQKQQVLGNEVTEEHKEKIQKLYDIVRLNPVLSRYLEVEYRFGQMMMDIQKTINEAVPIKRAKK